MEQPLVSVVISTYKRPVVILERAIVSVKNQTYKNIEIIVVNDAPEEKMLEENIKQMLKKMDDSRIVYFCMKKNSGACAARNFGIKMSKGEYISCLDDDDEWLPKKIELQVAAFTNEKIGLVYSPFYNITEDGNKRLVAHSTNSGIVYEEMCYRNIAGGCSMTMLSKKALDRCGVFDEALLSSQDYDLYLRIAEKFEFVYVGEPLIYRYLLNESITKNLEKQRRGWEMFNDKHKQIYLSNKKAYSYRLNRRVNDLIEAGQFSEAFSYYCRALKVSIFSKYNIIEPIKGFGKLLGFKKKDDII